MGKYFEHAYTGFCNSMEEILAACLYLGELLKIAFVYATLPVWFIPYAIYRNRKARK